MRSKSSLPEASFQYVEFACPARYHLNCANCEQVDHDLEYNDLSDVQVDQAAPQAMGIVAGLVDERKTAKEIVDEFVHDAVHLLRQSGTFLVPRRNL